MKRAAAYVRGLAWSANRNHYRVTLLWLAMVAGHVAVTTNPNWIG